MKRSVLFPLLVLMGCVAVLPTAAEEPPKKPPVPKRVLSPDAPNGWLTDLKAAEEMQMRSGEQPLVILFTCSDSDPLCIKLRDTMIDRGLFKNLIAPNSVKLYVDFPKKRKLLPQEQKANNQLKAKYKIAKFPTTVVISGKGKKKGKEVMRIVGCPADYVRRLQKVVPAPQTTSN